MTAIHQPPISSHHSIDDAGHHSGNRNEGGAGHGRQATDNSTGGPGSSTVNISFQATMRLRAYQEQHSVQPTSEPGTFNAQNYALKEGIIQPDSSTLSTLKTNGAGHPDAQSMDSSSVHGNSVGTDFSNFSQFPQPVDAMLSEVQSNLVHHNEPGYQHLVNLLNNYGSAIEEPQQLQDIMRREQFYLGRRKAFMNNSDFQSYSQVLNQFSNIVERQLYHA